MNLNRVSEDISHELEKFFYEMQSMCLMEIEKIEEILFSPEMLISENTNFEPIFHEATENIRMSISYTVRTYIDMLVPAEHYQLSTSMEKDTAISNLIKERFIDRLNMEIFSFANATISTIDKSIFLHPTIIKPYEAISQEIMDIRPSTLMDLAKTIDL